MYDRIEILKKICKAKKLSKLFETKLGRELGNIAQVCLTFDVRCALVYRSIVMKLYERIQRSPQCDTLLTVDEVNEKILNTY